MPRRKPNDGQVSTTPSSWKPLIRPSTDPTRHDALVDTCGFTVPLHSFCFALTPPACHALWPSRPFMKEWVTITRGLQKPWTDHTVAPGRMHWGLAGVLYAVRHGWWSHHVDGLGVRKHGLRHHRVLGVSHHVGLVYRRVRWRRHHVRQWLGRVGVARAGFELVQRTGVRWRHVRLGSRRHFRRQAQVHQIASWHNKASGRLLLGLSLRLLLKLLRLLLEWLRLLVKLLRLLVKWMRLLMKLLRLLEKLLRVWGTKMVLLLLGRRLRGIQRVEREPGQFCRNNLSEPSSRAEYVRSMVDNGLGASKTAAVVGGVGAIVRDSTPRRSTTSEAGAALSPFFPAFFLLAFLGSAPEGAATAANLDASSAYEYAFLDTFATVFLVFFLSSGADSVDASLSDSTATCFLVDEVFFVAFFLDLVSISLSSSSEEAMTSGFLTALERTLVDFFLTSLSSDDSSLSSSSSSSLSDEVAGRREDLDLCFLLLLNDLDVLPDFLCVGKGPDEALALYDDGLSEYVDVGRYESEY
ncbi:hypothetical protein H310_02241 [Aphanomyces invadans]|uniref:Uncharacterized protein n=1 Tax=Aphanomyces invadans TaxID=157072 RepID=A0A024UQ90_9STRA|nr:hypothetical protein H310_02241 [Aphanomyces invadans]ETW07813.1 hypothetical protein H310_02241 [Aphanomyces invadans]|eukprot:XP_008863906.1 hypothetical protein H310_02241 [Aphanomyces invadans]